jgi:hypothetical protein
VLACLSLSYKSLIDCLYIIFETWELSSTVVYLSFDPTYFYICVSFDVLDKTMVLGSIWPWNYFRLHENLLVMIK